jgi:phage gpG-like protein
MKLDIESPDLQELIAKFTPDILRKPFSGFFSRSAIEIQKGARENSPTDTGRLRSSIAYQIDSSSLPLWAEVGSNVTYAPFMEYGTGSQSVKGGGGTHWPPSAPLDLWARRHGFESGHQVARAIGRRGGLRPRQYLRKGFDVSLPAIRGHLNRLWEDLLGRLD